jgi:hypothetical protein
VHCGFERYPCPPTPSLQDPICGGFHLAMTEMVAPPHWISTRMGYWASADGVAWHRVSTLGQGSGNTNGTDWRSHLDAPMVGTGYSTAHGDEAHCVLLLYGDEARR